jgi:hypothetical protein
MLCQTFEHDRVNVNRRENRKNNFVFKFEFSILYNKFFTVKLTWAIKIVLWTHLNECLVMSPSHHYLFCLIVDCFKKYVQKCFQQWCQTHMAWILIFDQLKKIVGNFSNFYFLLVKIFLKTFLWLEKEMRMS